MEQPHHKKRFASWMSSFAPDAHAIRLHEIARMEVGDDFVFIPPQVSRILFAYTFQGEGCLSYGEESHTVKEGDAFFVDFSQPAEIRSISKKWDVIWIQMSGLLAYDLLKYIKSNRGYTMPVRADIPAMCEKLFDFAQEQKWSLHADLEISAILYRLMGIAMSVPLHDNRLEKSILYIHEHYEEDIPIELLARIACMSRSYYIRCFRENTGATPLDYINDYRIKKAQELLISTDKPISVISSLVGFNDPSYFTRQFKKLIGYLPREQRAFFRPAGNH